MPGWSDSDSPMSLPRAARKLGALPRAPPPGQGGGGAGARPSLSSCCSFSSLLSRESTLSFKLRAGGEGTQHPRLPLPPCLPPHPLLEGLTCLQLLLLVFHLGFQRCYHFLQTATWRTWGLGGCSGLSAPSPTAPWAGAPSMPGSPWDFSAWTSATVFAVKLLKVALRVSRSLRNLESDRGWNTQC